MAAIPRRLGEGGAHLVKGSGDPDLLTILDGISDDLATLRTFCNSLRTAYNATLAKLDADAGVTDVNYAATNPAPAAIGTLLTSKAGGV